MALLAALRAGEGTIEGASPARSTQQECVVEKCPEGLRLKFHPESGRASWWVLVNAAELEGILA